MMKTVLIGAGNIAQAHASVLGGRADVEVVGVVDPRMEQASALAARFTGCAPYASLDAFLAERECDAAHVLVPPNHHASVASQLLRHGVRVLLEKPVAASLEECEMLRAAARSSALVQPVYVNHNFVFHPAFLKLSEALKRNQYGPLASLAVTYAMPIRQISAGQFEHWMFQRPVNLLLEQAVHPISQVVALAGPIESVRAIAGPGTKINDKQEVPCSITAVLRCANADVQLTLQLGSSFRRWSIEALCADGLIEADIAANTFAASTRSQWIEPLDNYLSTRKFTAGLRREQLGNLVAYIGSTIGLIKSADAFRSSMAGSIGAFYATPVSEPPLANTLEGATGIVRACEQIARETFPVRNAPQRVPERVAAPQVEIAVIGGTGFIGRHIVRACVRKGIAVRVIGRQSAGLPSLFEDRLVSIVKADLRSADDLSRAVQGARSVINCAGPNLAETWEQSEPDIRLSMTNLAEACRAAEVKRLVHLGSTAALYLGDKHARVVGADPADTELQARPLYSRAKAYSETLLRELAARLDLSLCVLRPAIVVGEYGTPYHSGVGIFVNERHFIGWNSGDNPLPFVLASDVASAAIAATERAEAAGRCYNLAGDVRISAKAYVAELARVLCRPLTYHAQSTAWLWTSELAKFAIKRIGGRKGTLTTLRDLQSRSFLADLDCSDAKRDLGWTPVSNEDAFIAAALTVHVPQEVNRCCPEQAA